MNYKGFVDIQVNGFMGIDFSMPGLSIDDVVNVTLSLAKLGTIAYCPTVVTSSMEVYRDNLKIIAEAAKLPEISGHILGIHLEGPFISPTPGASGAHQAKYIIPPSIDDFKLMQEYA